MKTKALKLPDGGTFDLPIPNGFGAAPVIALNGAGPFGMSKQTMLLLGVGAAIVGVYFIYRSTQVN